MIIGDKIFIARGIAIECRILDFGDQFYCSSFFNFYG